MAAAVFIIVLYFTQCDSSQRLGKTMYFMAVKTSKSLMFPKANFGDMVLNNMEKYNTHLSYLISEIDQGNTTKELSSAKYLYRRGKPRYAKMMFNPKILSDNFNWDHETVKRFYDILNETSNLFSKFMALFQMKISFHQINWTPKTDIFGAKVTTYKVKKRHIKEIITG